MITYWAPAEGAFTFHEYLALRGKPLADRAQVQCYEQLSGLQRVRGPVHIFSGLDQLGWAGLTLLEDFWDRLAAARPGWKLLNDPRRVLRRRPFLEAMVAAGLNDFRVYSADEIPAHPRYPVFLREPDRHNGPLTGLLEDKKALNSALRALRWRGYRPRHLLVVEYIDTSGADGRFRKYAAYRVGSEIIRLHMMSSHHWAVKSNVNEFTLETAREGAAYLAGNDHESWLRAVFDLAGVEYGRIDYGIADGRPQAWEINTNPTTGRRLGRPPEAEEGDAALIREAARASAHGKLLAAFSALDQGPEGEALVLQLPEELVRTAVWERRALKRRSAVLRGARAVYESKVVGWPIRRFFRSFLRRR